MAKEELQGGEPDADYSWTEHNVFLFQLNSLPGVVVCPAGGRTTGWPLGCLQLAAEREGLRKAIYRLASVSDHGTINERIPFREPNFSAVIFLNPGHLPLSASAKENLAAH